MDLSLSDDQVAILDALDSLCRPYESVPLHDTSFALTSDALDRELAEGGFLDIGFDPDLGTVTAALVVERLARLPFAVEAAASAVVRPVLGDVARPVCLIAAAHWRRPVRFLRAGATVVTVGQEVASRFVATADDLVVPAESLFGYPVAGLTRDPAARGDALDVPTIELRTRWRIAVAAESSGLLAAALASVVSYVTDRQQFGRPIATFQAVRHRLAEAQVRANALHWLMLKAAATLDAGDAALALLHAQETIGPATYDFHQFLGAMGMTLEHPLHLWSYRLKLLAGELGGRGGQGLAAADAIWGASAE